MRELFKSTITIAISRYVILLFLMTPAVTAMADDEEDINYAAWMSQLPDTMRLSQLSIPWAHDAATWSANFIGMIIDQKLDEIDQFKAGVRAFDMRVNNKYNEVLAHGNQHWIGSGLNYFDDEIEHLPDTTLLGNECIFFSVKPEGDDADDWKIAEGSNFDDTRSAVCAHFIKKLIKKYGKKRFVKWTDQLTMGQLRGKVILIDQSPGVYPDDIEDVPISYYSTVSVIDKSNQIRLKSIKSRNTKNGENQVEGYSIYNEWNDNEEKPSKLMAWFKANLEYYHSLIDDANSKNMFLFNYLNGWKVGPGSVYSAADHTNEYDIVIRTGANHLAYEYLKAVDKPLGFVAFDFCGYDGNDGLYYGDKLTKEIVRHNFIQHEGFIGDIAVCSAPKGDSEHCMEVLRSNGYTPLKTNLNSGTSNNNVLYLGVKYTHDAATAIKRIAVMRVEDGDDSDFKKHKTSVSFANRTFSIVNSYNYKDEYFIGDLTRGSTSSTHFYLLASRDYVGLTPDDILSNLAIVVNSKADENYINFSNYKSGGTAEATDTYADLNKGQRGDYVYLLPSYHIHSAKVDTAFTETQHYLECPSCHTPYATTVEPHDFAYDTQDYNTSTHVKKCTYCKYAVTEDCTVTDDGYDSKGYGVCSICKMKIYQHPELVDDTYEISNVGQFLWFENRANYFDRTINGRLKSDIDLSGIDVLPIGVATYEELKGLNDYEDKYNVNLNPIGIGYSGTFDGCGHTISGFNYSDAWISNRYYGKALFGYVHGATIKNLSLKNASILSKDDAGSFAAQIDDSNIENVFSDAQITAATGIAGGIAAKMRNCTVKNSLFLGTLKSMVYGRLENSGCYVIGRKRTADEPQTNVISNIYTKENTDYYDMDSTYIQKCDDSQLASGEICWKLNEEKYGTTCAWHQNLDAYPESDGYTAEKLPTLDTTHGIIVPVTYEDKVYMDFKPKTDDNGTVTCTRSSFALDDDKTYKIPVTFTADKATYKRKVSGGYYSFCLPFGINLDEAPFKKVYTMCNPIEMEFDWGLVLKFKEATGTMNNMTPFIALLNDEGPSDYVTLESEGSTIIGYPVSNPDMTPIPVTRISILIAHTNNTGLDENIDLKWGGTLCETPWAEHQYSLNADGSFSPRPQTPLRAYRAYALLEMKDIDAAKQVYATFESKDGTVTGVMNMRTNEFTRTPLGTYSIDGKYLGEDVDMSALPHGIYIVNGKRVQK